MEVTLPLRLPEMIRYILVLADDSLEEASLFQGISPSMLEMDWAMRLISWLPIDVYDFGLSLQARTARRLTGKGWSWTPLTLSNFLKLTITDSDPFWVALCASEREYAAVVEWERRQSFPILKIATSGRGGLKPGVAKWRHVRNHLRDVARKLHKSDRRFPYRAISTTLKAWQEPDAPVLQLDAKPHNCTLPNLVVLQSLGYRFRDEETLSSPPGDEGPHIAAIKESADAVIEIQDGIPPFPASKIYPPKPDRIVIAPALYAHARQRLPRPHADDLPGLRQTIRLIQQQTGYIFHGSGRSLAPMMSDAGQFILATRMKELNAQTLAVSLRAASTLAATIRLPNGVNTATELSNFAAHVRGGRSARGNNKAERVFRSAQLSLEKHCHFSLIEVVSSSQTGVKLVADAPLEWLPIGDLHSGMPYQMKLGCNLGTVFRNGCRCSDTFPSLGLIEIPTRACTKGARSTRSAALPS